MTEAIRAVAPYIQLCTAGVNPADNVASILFAHRDPVTLEWSHEPRMALPGTDAPPLKAPAWWHMSKRKTMFHMGTFSGDVHRIMMSASSVCVDSREDAMKLDDPFRDVEAYIRSITPPKYLYKLDPILMQKGKAVFKNHCARWTAPYFNNGSVPSLEAVLDSSRRPKYW